MDSWRELASYLAALSGEERALFSRHAGVDLPGEREGIEAVLLPYARRNPAARPSELLATTAAQAGSARERDFARRIGAAALELAQTREERQLAHVCLAQIHFQNRRDPEELAAFEEHCRAAVELGHSGTFCYERLATLYEYRGELERAVGVCERAVSVLEAAGDARSAERFRKKRERLRSKHSAD